ncbi:hypothetical protein ES708_03042 [subsurface metagenome]
MRSLGLILIITTIFTGITDAQSIVEEAKEQESELSKIMKGSGTLSIRESHNLKPIPTASGKDIECEIMVLQFLSAGKSREDNVIVGLVLSRKEEYSTRTANIDPDEIDGFIASLDIIAKEGLDYITTPLILTPGILSTHSEIHYRTKDGTVLGVFESKGALRYALKISSVADWAILNPGGPKILLQNLKTTKEVAQKLAPPIRFQSTDRLQYLPMCGNKLTE